jgi:phosphoglycolate phosphatase
MRACIFDLDGTLVNTLPTVQHYCNLSLAHFGLQSVSQDACRNLCRLPIASFYHRLVRLGGCPEEQVAALAPRVRDYDVAAYLTDYRYLTEPYSGIAELLQALQKRGVVTAVLTNKPAKVAENLMSDLFPGAFAIVRGQTPETISKPDPRSLWNLLSDLHVRRDQCVYVGDTDVDMDTARAAGVLAAAATWGFQERELLLKCGPDFVADTPEDLLALF